MLFPLILAGIALAIIAKSASANARPAASGGVVVEALPGADVPASVALTPFGDLPESAKNGIPHRTQETGDSGSIYVVDSYAPDITDRTFHVAQLFEPGFPANVAPWTSFVSYWHDRQTGARELYRAYSPNDASGAIVTTMTRDFGLAIADAEEIAV